MCRLPLVHLPVLLLLLPGLLLSLIPGIDAFRMPMSTSFSSSYSATTRQSSSAAALLAPISLAALAGRRRGNALAVFSGIVEQMGTVRGVQLKDMVLWSGDTGKGTWVSGGSGDRKSVV